MMLSTLLQCCIVIGTQIKLTVVVVDKRPLIDKKKKKGLELLLSKNIASNTTVSGRRYNQLTYKHPIKAFQPISHGSSLRESYLRLAVLSMIIVIVILIEEMPLYITLYHELLYIIAFNFNLP